MLLLLFKLTLVFLKKINISFVINACILAVVVLSLRLPLPPVFDCLQHDHLILNNRDREGLGALVSYPDSFLSGSGIEPGNEAMETWQYADD